MSEISYYDFDLEEALISLEKVVNSLSKKSSKTQEILKEAEKKYADAQELKKGYNMALRQLTDRSDAAHYRQKMAQYSTRLDAAFREMKWISSDGDRNALMGSASKQAAFDPTGSSNDQTLQATTDVQKQAKASLFNTQRMVEESKSIAAATNVRLQDQTEQISGIADNVMRMDDTLGRADRLIRTFSRRMATDRVVLFFAFLVFVGIVAIVVYSMVNPDQTDFQVPDEVKPPNPSDFRKLRH